MDALYHTYVVATDKNGTVYYLTELLPSRVWTKKVTQAMAWHTGDEVKDIINKFNIPHAKVGRRAHYE